MESTNFNVTKSNKTSNTPTDQIAADRSDNEHLVNYDQQEGMSTGHEVEEDRRETESPFTISNQGMGYQ